MSEAILQMVNLADIVPSKTNQMHRETWELKPDALKELVDSIKISDVIQPVLLRPDGKPGKYYLVAGERRFAASKLAGRTEIPAFIKILTDIEAFDLQITENLQRKDVHPLKEAQAFQLLLEHDKAIGTKELSVRFGKGEKFIAQRLSLNSLTDDLRKEFYDGKLLLSHALLLARLTPEDQKKVSKGCKIQYGDLAGTYQPVAHMEQFIKQSIVHELKEATWDLADDKLFTQAGACNGCVKRSDGNVLFSEEGNGRCFDGHCYNVKRDLFIVSQILDVSINDNDTPIVSGYGNKMSAAVNKALQKNSLKVLSQFNDYDVSKKSEKGAIKALCVAGNDAGKYIWIKLKQKDKEKPAAKKEVTTADKIRDLQNRLSEEKNQFNVKVAQAISKKLFDLKPFKDVDGTPLSKHEKATLIMFINNECYGGGLNKARTALHKLKPAGMKPNDPGYEVEQMAMAPEALINTFFRAAITYFLEGNEDNSNEAHVIRKIANGYKGIDVKKIETQFKADHDKIEAGILEKIAALKSQSKPAAKKAIPKKK